MTRTDWESGGGLLGVFLNGREIVDRTPEGGPVADDSFLVLFNASPDPVEFVLPPRRFGARWALDLSTAAPDVAGIELAARSTLTVEARSLVVLRRP